MQSVNIGREEEKRRRGEQGNKVKEKERGVMAEEEEERVEAGEVVKERGEQGNKVKQKKRGVMVKKEEERAEAGEVEKERGEQGNKVKQKERGVMAEEEEEKAEAGKVVKERFKCSEWDKDYAFLHKLQNHKIWSCKKKKEAEEIKRDFARRQLSSNVFSLESKVSEKAVPVAADPAHANPSKVDSLKNIIHYHPSGLVWCCL